jgi:hypothetical protein
MVSAHRYVFVAASYEFRIFVVYGALRERTRSSVFASHAKRRKFGHVARHRDAIYDLTDLSLRRVRVESRDDDVFVDVHPTLHELFEPRKKLSLVYGNYVGVGEFRHVYHVEDVIHLETRERDVVVRSQHPFGRPRVLTRVDDQDFITDRLSTF